jgi:uncharacterized protein (UPF0548 family)
VPVLVGRVGDERLAQMADSARSLPFSYREVGATRGSPPDGYRLDDYSIDLGETPESFARAVEGLQRWIAHRRAGARIAPEDAPIETGQTVAIAVRIGLFTAVAPCRIVYVVDEPDRYGFAYGTLVGHPEQGEERFLVRREANGVTFTVTAFSRPASLWTRCGRPVARAIQTSTTRRYLAGLKSFVESP